MERTLVILKPDAVARDLVDQIITRFEEAGLRVIGKKCVQATEAQLSRHFPITEEWVTQMGERACLRVSNEFGIDPTECFGTSDPSEIGFVIIRGCHDYYRSGSLVPLVLEGFNVVDRVRQLIGNTLPSKAVKGTIRGDFGIPEDMEQLRGGAARNLVHASDSIEEAAREIKVWFTPEEISNA